MGFWVNSSERSMSESEGSADLEEGRGCEAPRILLSFSRITRTRASPAALKPRDF